MDHDWFHTNNSDKFSICNRCGMCKYISFDVWYYYASKEFDRYLGVREKEPTCNEILMIQVLE